MTQVSTMIIDARFRGPPSSANGGYACGLVAGLLDAPAVEATLRSPPPLGRALLGEAAGERSVLRDGDQVVAEATAVTLDLEVPAPVDFADAARATRGFPSMTDHPFPGCFVCGPEREAGDGLRILPGAVEGRAVAAAPWVPDPSLAGADGRVDAAVVWAALDCPSWFGMHCFHPWREGGVLLGRLAARVVTRPRVGERCVAAGWFMGREGRKMTMGSALYGDDGEVRALARATWIALRA